MAEDNGQYKLFFDFIKAYSKQGFRGIDRNDPLIVSLEEILDSNNQFLLVFDMLHMKKEFTSLGSFRMMGVKPEELTAYHFKEATHPDDLKRHEVALSKLFKIAHELYVAKKGEMMISTDFRFRSPSGDYLNHLVQCYFFYSPEPWNTVHLLHIYTDISKFKKLRHGCHFYVGNDLSYFRYPDEKLLMVGNIFSERELEIIKLIQSGYDSEKIAEKLFLSKHTVNTHRKNILEKTGKSHIPDLIYELKEQGLL
jgi:DNA-binding CsgD family transcriptional regulator